MKKALLSLLLLATASIAFSETKTETNVVVRPLPLTINSEGQDLAAGFAVAFSRLRRVPFHIQLQRKGGEPTVINDIKAVSAAGATLLVETNKNLIFIINPKDVIWISDAPVEKSAATATAK